jgi:hypothetical protein
MPLRSTRIGSCIFHTPWRCSTSKRISPSVVGRYSKSIVSPGPATSFARRTTWARRGSSAPSLASAIYLGSRNVMHERPTAELEELRLLKQQAEPCPAPLLTP